MSLQMSQAGVCSQAIVTRLQQEEKDLAAQRAKLCDDNNDMQSHDADSKSHKCIRDAQQELQQLLARQHHLQV